jgi:hypothetical protein
MKMLSIKSQAGLINTSGPGLVGVISGGFYYQSFGEYEKVNYAIVGSDANSQVNSGIGTTNKSGYTLYVYPTIVSMNQVRVNIEKTQSLSGGVTIVAVSGDLCCQSNTFTVMAYGE